MRMAAEMFPTLPPFLEALGEAPWPLVLACAAALVWAGPYLWGVVLGLLTAAGVMAPGVAFAGVVGGLALACARWWRYGAGEGAGAPSIIGSGPSARPLEDWRDRIRRRPLRTALGALFLRGEHRAVYRAAGASGGGGWRFAASTLAGAGVWAALVLSISYSAGLVLVMPARERFGAAGLAVSVGVALALPRLLLPLASATGRRRLGARASRLARYEYWPELVLYLPLLPYLAWLSVRHRGPMVFTCCNPGIPAGGGIVGESKKQILDVLAGAGAPILPAALIRAGPPPERRAVEALDAIAGRPDLRGFPVVLKPDAGYRGFGVKLARSPADIHDYMRRTTAPVQVQAYHPGPHECGILWARFPARMPAPGGRAGFIYSITRKEFPIVVGDGRRTLERLIYDHPRLRRQAGQFLERFAHRRDGVPAAGEAVRLAHAGNHCQGTLFRDGADLATPRLEERIDRIARSFRSADGGGLDIGRFDVRYQSEEDLRAGRGFAIVELNGTSGESTNIYDPAGNIFWALGILAGQWRLLYELGAARRDAGARPMSAIALIAALRAFLATRSGPAIAD